MLLVLARIDLVYLCSNERIKVHDSSNIKEFIRAVLNPLLLFYEKISYAAKAPKAPKAQKRKQAKVQNATSKYK